MGTRPVTEEPPPPTRRREDDGRTTLPGPGQRVPPPLRPRPGHGTAGPGRAAGSEILFLLDGEKEILLVPVHLIEAGPFP